MQYDFGNSEELLAQAKSLSQSNRNHSKSSSYREDSSDREGSISRRTRSTATTNRGSNSSRRSGRSSHSSSRSGRRRHSSRWNGEDGGGGGGRGGSRESSAGKPSTSRSAKASHHTKNSRSTRSSRSSGGELPNSTSSSSVSRGSIDPDGHPAQRIVSASLGVVDTNSEDEEDYLRSARSKKLDEVEQIAQVEKYSHMARKKASLMTNHDFERGDEDGDDNDEEDRHGSKRSSRGSGKTSSRAKGHRSKSSKSSYDGSLTSRERRRRIRSPSSRSRQSNSSKSKRNSHRQLEGKIDPDNVRSKKPSKIIVEDVEDDEENSVPMTVPGKLPPSPPCPIPPQGQEGIPHDMTGATIGSGGGCATTVSSMSTTDSYVKKHLHFWELKRQEREDRRRRREEQKRQAEIMGGYFDEGHNNDDETVYLEEDMDDEESYFPTSFCDDDLSSEDDEGGNDYNTRTNSNYGESRNSGGHVSSNRTSVHTTSSPLVYQREECCIKHPGVLLSNQTDINVWTCMRYCKDPKNGRWHTVKMVCEKCLAEDEECHVHDTPFHRRMRTELRGFRPQNNHMGYHRPPQDPTGADESFSSVSSADMNNKDIEDDGTCSTSSLFTDAHTTVYSTPSLKTKHSNHHDRETIDVLPMEGFGNQTPLERESEAQRRRFIRRLAARAYHFPGNTWCEDWTQYIGNTHLVFGIFFHHPLHPVTSWERCVILLGSVAVGLLLSNLIYLWFVYYEFGMDDIVLSLGPKESLKESLNVTKLMITLWTFGSFVHTCFDLSIWHIKACTLCRYGSHESYVSDYAVKCGRTAGVTIVLLTLAFATYLVFLRASEDYKYSFQAMADVDEDDEAGESFLQPIIFGGGAQYFDFLAGYVVEFILAVFVYNPLMLTIVFTGVLGCNGKIPIVGGRPRELKQQQRYAMKRQRYTMPQVLKLGNQEYEADTWGNSERKLATSF